ncbi:glutathione S-transferase family protein [Sphingomonas sp. RHCKR7]|uniref:glutathione S-transferase family protein n=1 Tax=Sphingomonas folli TaxID=2862497 RepID=UPI001C6738DC|nr:glutathione S-transferase family protein [Sphingomonas folli]MBW6528960.1 glutathione S-transferase family protein [Sphingomonas folli]
MKLYYDPISTTSRPVTFFAAEAGFALQLELVDLLAGETRAPAFLAVNPMGHVPVLVDGDFVLTEAAAILRYLARRLAPDYLGRDDQEQARVDEAMSWASTDVRIWLDVFSVYPAALGVPAGLSAASVAEMQQVAAPAVRQIMSVLDERLRDGFIAGCSITIADFLAFSYITLSELIVFDFDECPNVVAWLRRMKAMPGYGSTYAAFLGLVSAKASQGS